MEWEGEEKRIEKDSKRTNREAGRQWETDMAYYLLMMTCIVFLTGLV